MKRCLPKCLCNGNLERRVQVHHSGIHQYLSRPSNKTNQHVIKTMPIRDPSLKKSHQSLSLEESQPFLKLFSEWYRHTHRLIFQWTSRHLSTLKRHCDTENVNLSTGFWFAHKGLDKNYVPLVGSYRNMRKMTVKQAFLSYSSLFKASLQKSTEPPLKLIRDNL